MKKHTKTSLSTENRLKQHFIGAICIVTVAAIATQMYYSLRQWSEVATLDMSYLFFVWTLLLPALLFVLGWWLLPKKYLRFERIFWAAIIMAIAYLLFSAGQFITAAASVMAYPTYFGHPWWLGELVRSVVCLVPVVAYYIYLYIVLRRSK